MEPYGQMKSVQVSEVPLFFIRGDSAVWRFRLWADDGRTEPYDLTGAVVTSQIRQSHDTPRAASLLCEVGLPNLVTARLSADVSARCPAGGRWDMRAVWPDGRVTTLVRGPVTVTLDVTRD